MAMEVPSLDGLAIGQDPQAIKAAKDLKAKEEEKAKQEKKARKIALELENIARLSAQDVEEQFKTSHRFKEFQYKVWAVAFLLKLPADSGAQIFARDIVFDDKKLDDGPKKNGGTGAKTFYVSVAKVIYRRSDSALTNGKPEMCYEWAGENMKIADTTVKTGVDLDMEGVPVTRPFNDDIVWVATYINHAITQRYKVEVKLSLWVVLKCDYDPVKQKHSAHLILDGFMWPNIAARKKFFESSGLVEEFAKRCPEANKPSKVVDDGVFGVKFFRLLKSSKAGKNLPLWGASLPGMMVPTNELAFFQKSMTTYTVGCQLLEDPAGALTTALAASSVPGTPTVLANNIADKSPSENSGSPTDRFVPPWSIVLTVLNSIDVSKRCADNTYNEWSELGWCVANLARDANEVENGRRAWLEFCRQAPDTFNERVATDIYDKARQDGKKTGWSSMMKWLAEDDPTVHEAVKTQLRDIKRNQASQSFHDVEYVISRGGSDTSFARLLVDRSHGVYAASNSKGAPNLFKFDMYWRAEADKMLIVDLLKLVPEFDMKLTEANIENLEVSGEDEDDTSLKDKKTARSYRRKQIQMCISKLESNGHKNSIVREFAALVYKNNFASRLDGDSSAHLLCFEDGVYDLNAGTWRDPKPEDMISVSTGYSLRNVEVDLEVRNSIRTVLFAPFVNDGVALSRMIMNAAALNGAINFKKVLIDTGSKNNGKSSQNEFFADALGDYALTLPNSVLTSRIDAGKPFPELDRAKKARCALVNDFESGHKILPGNFKALSGGDKQATRGLWANIDEWRPRFQLRIACNNDLPEFQNNGGGDEGILTRLLMYHFAKRFSENPRSQNELLIDRSVPAKLASLEWKQQYMLWLLDLYTEYRLVDGILPEFPQEVIEVTNAYKREVDTLQLFVEKYLRLDKDKKDPQFYVFKTPLYDHYVLACEKEKCTALKNQQFSKQIRGMLNDNYKYRGGSSSGGGSNRDQHYVGIELVPIPPDTPKDRPQSPFVPDDPD